MAKDNPRDKPRHSPRGENRRAARPERSRDDKSAHQDATNSSSVDVGTRGANAGLQMQRQIFELLEGIGRKWLARVTSTAELTFKLPSRLTAAPTIPDAFSAYQAWLGEWFAMVGEDARDCVADGQRLMEAGMRCFAETSPVGTR